MKTSKTNILIALLIIGIIVLGAAVYYFKVVRQDQASLASEDSGIKQDKIEQTLPIEQQAPVKTTTNTNTETKTKTDAELNKSLDDIDSEMTNLDPDDFSDDFSDLN